MEEPIAWVMNLDADVELDLGRLGSYTPGASVSAAMRPHVARLATSMLRAGDVLLEDSASGDARGLSGRAFCPTPRALAVMARAGVVPEAHPSFEVLRTVNSRAFASTLGPTLPGATFVTTKELAETVVSTEPAIGDGWRVKFSFGMSGRNQRVLSPGQMTAADRVFLVAGLARGGVQVEPHVTIQEEYATHGFLARDGSLQVGVLVRQRCDARGGWISSERASDVDEAVSQALADEMSRVAAALSVAGYFGPFGVDAYTYVGRGGRLELQPRSEINARYSMGFPVGFGAPPAPLR